MMLTDRSLFDIPDSVAYLNCAYMSPMLNAAVAAGEKALHLKSHPWEIRPEDFFRPAEQLRTQFAELFGLEKDGVFLCSSASYGLSTAAKALGLGKGKKILILKQQFPSNVYPWRNLAQHNSGRLIYAERRQGETWTEAVEKALSDTDVEIMALPHCHWTDGARLELPYLATLARARGIKLVLDLSQSLGANPIDLNAIDPDFMVSVGYKWLFGPMGLAFGYAAKRWREAEPLDFNWSNRDQAEDFSQLVNYRDRYQVGARRFDLGGKNSVNFMMASVALDQLKQWSIEAISSHTRHLTDHLCDQVVSLGLEVEEEKSRSPHMVGVRLPGSMDPDTLAKKLANEKIFVSVRGKSVRVSPHVYNSVEDMDRLVSCLKSSLKT